MPPLRIYTYGHPVLRKRAAEVPRVGDELARLAEDMLETMYQAHGIGLAAPQVGQGLRLVVVDVSGEEEERKPLVLFNPTVTSKSGECAAEEGCLSVPDLWADVVRPEIITVRAWDKAGKEFELKDIGGMLARCIQHEIDHLDGVLFVDKISATDRLLNNAKLKKLAKEAKAEPKAGARKTAAG